MNNPKRKINNSCTRRTLINNVSKRKNKIVAKPISTINSYEYAPKIGNGVESSQKWIPAIASKINSVCPDSSLYSLLKYFNLEQYYDKLITIGFGDSNPLVQFLKVQNRRKLINQLNCMPGHNNRFLRMFSKLEKMLPRDGKKPDFIWFITLL